MTDLQGMVFPVLLFKADDDLAPIEDAESLLCCGVADVKSGTVPGSTVVDATGRRWRVEAMRVVKGRGSLLERWAAHELGARHIDLDLVEIDPVSTPDLKAQLKAWMRRTWLNVYGSPEDEPRAAPAWDRLETLDAWTDAAPDTRRLMDLPARIDEVLGIDPDQGPPPKRAPEGWRRWFSYDGRADAAEFRRMGLPAIALALAVFAFGEPAINGSPWHVGLPLGIALIFAPLISGAFSAARRLHDFGRSGVWICLSTFVYRGVDIAQGHAEGAARVAIVAAGIALGAAALAVLSLAPGQPGRNAFGPPPADAI